MTAAARTILPEPQRGRIVAAFGRHYEVEVAGGATLIGVPRGKKSPYACGDEVDVVAGAPGQCRIVAHAARRSLLYRSDAFKAKLIAANVSQIIVITATEPGFSDEMLARALVAAASQNLRALIVLNKVDLAGGLPPARRLLADYPPLGYPVLEMAGIVDASPLLPWLRGHQSVLVGQSGMGKSTLINALMPQAGASTRETSTALGTGKHTTTHARLYRLDDSSAIIDCPGLQEFGLAHLRHADIERGFVEFRPYQGKCRFRNCRHAAEPDCAVKDAVAAGAISARRYEVYCRVSQDASRGQRTED